jgi:serine/threonine protein kinase
MPIKIIDELGRGGFGTVYRVQRDDGYLYAMKTLEPSQQTIDAIGFDQLKRRFLREIKYQSSVDHPNVVKILGTDENRTPPAFFMYLAAGTLEKEIKADRTLGGNASRVLFDILAGLQAIHECGFVHRDLKPSNVLRFDVNGAPQFAVSDFGLMSSPDGHSTTLTASDAGGGTPFYAAPELVVSLKKATPAADIYSFGAILHDIFVGNGRVPYTQLTGPGDIGLVIERCTKRHPLRRYKSVAELRDDLFKALNTSTLAFTSDEEGSVVELLNTKPELDEAEWDRVFILLESLVDSQKSIYNVCRALAIPHIDQLATSAPELFAAMAQEFCVHVRGQGFDWDYCDVLADKLERFFLLGSVEVKARALLAMLVLGTKHNRWFVERKFVQYASEGLEPAVAARFLIEAEVEGESFAGHILHMERSIGVARTVLHPILLAASNK